MTTPIIRLDLVIAGVVRRRQMKAAGMPLATREQMESTFGPPTATLLISEPMLEMLVKTFPMKGV